MSVIIQIGILAAGFILTSLLAAYQLGKRKPPAPDQFQNPRTASGQPIPVLYGTFRVRPIVTWVGGVASHDVKTANEFLGGLVSKSIVTGYMYGVTLQGVLCWGKVDTVENMIFGDKIALSDQGLGQQSQDETTRVTQAPVSGRPFVRYAGTGPDSIEIFGNGYATMQLFLPNLYGGYGRGGGVRGEITLIIGSLQTGVPTLLEDFMGVGNVPTYGDLVTVLYHDLIVGESAVPPSIDYVLYREPRTEFLIPGGSGSAQTNPRWITHAYYGFPWLMLDLNAAAIIYDVLRNPLYGLGFSPDQIAGAGAGISNGLSGSFEDAQRALVAEGLGMSMLCGGAGEQTTAQAVIDECLRTADAVLLRDPATFQWKLRLMRNEAPTTTAFNALRSFSESTGLKDLEWNIPDPRTTINQVTVEFSDAERLFKTNTVTLRNGANVAATGSIRKKTVQYLAVTDIAVAMKCCARELKASSIPLATGTARFDRSAFDAERGDVVKLNFAKHGLSNRQVRILSVDLGDPNDAEITADVIEDVFQFDDFEFTRISAPAGGVPRFQTIIPPSVVAAAETRTLGVGSSTVSLLDPEHRITEIASRSKVGDATPSTWTVVGTASPDPTDLSFPFNDHVTDGDFNGDIVVTTPLVPGVESQIEVRLTYVGYSTIADPTSDLRTVSRVITFPLVGPSESTLSGGSDPIVWDVTGKSDDAASVTISGNKSLVIIGAEPGFRGRLLINSTGAGGYTLTLPDESIIGDGSSLVVALLQHDQLSVYYDGSHYWWNHDTSAARPDVLLATSLSASAALLADLKVGARFTAALQAQAALTAALTVPINLAAALSGGATLTADLTVGVSYRTLTISHTMVSGATKTNFKVWFDVTHADLKSVANGGLVANQNHIRLATDTAGTSLYDYDIEVWDAATGRVAGWVLIASLSNAIDTVLYIAFNDNGITTYQGNRTSVWANDTLVYHLGDGTTLSGVDSCGSGFDLTSSGSPTAVAGKVYGGMHTAAASSQKMSRGTQSSIEVGTTFSISGWYKPTTDFSAFRTIFSNGTGNQRNFWFGTNITNGVLAFNFTQGSANFIFINAATPLVIGTWAHWAATYDGTTQRVFLNGVQDGTHAASGSPDVGGTGSALIIGGLTGTSDYAEGDHDEVRLVKGTAHDADWWLTEVRNQGSPGTYITLT